MVTRLLTGALALIALIGTVQDASAHPLHTSMTKLHFDARTRSVVLSVRVFEDDFTRSSELAGKPMKLSGSKARQAYVTGRVRLMDGRGLPVLLSPCGERRVNEMLWLCFQGKGEILGGSLANSLMFETFDDQVNIVQAALSGKKTSFLFTRKDTAKRVPRG